MVNDDILQLLASEAGPTLKSIAEELLRRRHEADYPVPVRVEDMPRVMRGDIEHRTTWEQVAQDRQDVIDKQRKELEVAIEQRNTVREDRNRVIDREKRLVAQLAAIEGDLETCRKAADDLRTRAEIAEACAKEWEKTSRDWEARTLAREIERNRLAKALRELRDSANEALCAVGAQ